MLIVRLFAVLLIAVVLNASECSHCEGKFQDAFYSVGGTKALYMGNQKSFAIDKPSVDAIHNPFLGIYLIKGESHFQSVERLYPFVETNAGLFENGALERDINFSKQCGLREFVKTSVAVEPFSILSGICCHLLALANSEGKLIDAKFLDDFLKRERALYGDIGVRFNAKMEVEFINPYYNINLQRGDRVSNFNSLCQLEDRIVFSPIGGSLNLRILRGGQTITQALEVRQRFGGAMISDTFLEQFGLQFGENLEIVAVQEGSIAHQRGLKVGDRLLRVQNNAVENARDLKRFLTLNPQSKYSYLIDRDNFQFFIEI